MTDTVRSARGVMVTVVSRKPMAAAINQNQTSYSPYALPVRLSLSRGAGGLVRGGNCAAFGLLWIQTVDSVLTS
jgi:hypothetical protein